MSCLAEPFWLARKPVSAASNVYSRLASCMWRHDGFFLKDQAAACSTRLEAALSNVGALTIRIGFQGFLIIIIVYSTPKPYSNFLRPLYYHRQPLLKIWFGIGRVLGLARWSAGVFWSDHSTRDSGNASAGYGSCSFVGLRHRSRRAQALKEAMYDLRRRGQTTGLKGGAKLPQLGLLSHFRGWPF